ncbi:hypothetical protein VNO80_28905 [Phaseolus coccineus]|uniref:Uncharacterized protein n=1 Tax=Phaseolus coccineus TaxID=3886 RepID=A0AAN9L9Y0_PHACN
MGRCSAVPLLWFGTGRIGWLSDVGLDGFEFGAENMSKIRSTRDILLELQIRMLEQSFGHKFTVRENCGACLDASTNH